ncbi:gluconokinase [Agromyces cerinus]|uniref:Gluconokinase n=1 Tax=Agromyces cerinus subsp. cerinus TaxID=232089 RepID=A0A1N6I3H7_9MICO|nr:gluconokinase [Agromyces cerinus]SIO26584.1 gluconokinase [Agromyces cerinus subsp. cerinus]
MGIRIVVMGVSAAGKSTVGRLLGKRLGVPFRDADELHPAANVQKMASGAALDDADREPWLDSVGAELDAATTGIVMACSALKRSYRDRLRLAAPSTVFVHLHGSHALLAARAAARVDHFMPASLLDSQLAALEPLAADEAGITVDVSGAPAEIADRAATGLRPYSATITPRS